MSTRYCPSRSGVGPILILETISTRLQASYGPIENEDSGQRVVIDGMLFRNGNRDLGGSGDKSRDHFCKRPREGGKRTRQVSREVERRAAGRSRRGGTTGRQQEEERTIGRPRERTRRKGARNRTDDLVEECRLCGSFSLHREDGQDDAENAVRSRPFWALSMWDVKSRFLRRRPRHLYAVTVSRGSSADASFPLSCRVRSEVTPVPGLEAAPE
jgi:hypothetical protein